MTVVSRLCSGVLAGVLGAGCANDGVFDIEVQSCQSQRDAPIAYAVFYSIDGEPQTCYIEPCQVDSIAGCLIGAETPEVPSGSLLEIQVVLYEQGPSQVACSQPIERNVNSDTTLVLPLQCDPPIVDACPLPDLCQGGPS